MILMFRNVIDNYFRFFKLKEREQNDNVADILIIGNIFE